jgi:hypothetical protein
VFSAEMPDEPSSAIPPLDADTAERLLGGRLDPDDAPPGYAEVARLLGAAAAPADQAEPTGEAAAMHAYRTTLPRGRPNAPRTQAGWWRWRWPGWWRSAGWGCGQPVESHFPVSYAPPPGGRAPAGRVPARPGRARMGRARMGRA